MGRTPDGYLAGALEVRVHTKVMARVATIVMVLVSASRRLLLLGWLAATFFAGQQLAAQEPESLRKRVLIEMPQAYERYREYCQKLQGTAKLTERFYNVKASKRQENITHYEVKWNKDCASWMFQFLGEERFDGELSAVNPNYAFQIKRNRREADWFLVSCDPSGGDGSLFRGEPVRVYVERFLTGGYQLYGTALSDLAKSSNFKLQQVIATRREGVDIVRLDFDSSHPISALPFSPVQGGTVFLDPSRNWCILEYRLRAEWGDGKGSISATYTYQNSNEGMPILATVNRVIRNESNPVLGTESLLEFDLHESSRLPGNEEFTLSAHGLPEPGHVRRSVPWYLLAAVGGIVCLAMAIFLHRRAKRTRSTLAGQ